VYLTWRNATKSIKATPPTGRFNQKTHCSIVVSIVITIYEAMDKLCGTYSPATALGDDATDNGPNGGTDCKGCHNDPHEFASLTKRNQIADDEFH